jgi:putative lipoprotein
MTGQDRVCRARRLGGISLCLAAVVALGLLVSACGSSEQEEERSPVTGTVTYRERIALPDDAVVTVRIQDVTRMDAAAQVMGEQVIHTSGSQVPVAYAVPYDPEAIDDGYSYSMSARIEDGAGKLLFISDTVVPVITRDNPTKDVEIVVVSAGSP